MALRSRQKLWQKVTFSWVTLIILVLLTVLLTRGVLGMWHKNARAQARAEEARVELHKVEERESTLSKSLEYIKTTKGVEAELRRKFDVAMEGEHLMVIVDKEVEPEVPEVEEPWWRALWHKLSK